MKIRNRHWKILRFVIGHPERASFKFWWFCLNVRSFNMEFHDIWSRINTNLNHIPYVQHHYISLNHTSPSLILIRGLSEAHRELPVSSGDVPQLLTDSSKRLNALFTKTWHVLFVHVIMCTQASNSIQSGSFTLQCLKQGFQSCAVMQNIFRVNKYVCSQISTLPLVNLNFMFAACWSFWTAESEAEELMLLAR